MPGFDKNEFWLKIVSMYPDAKENNYLLRLNSEQIKELKEIYIDQYISINELCHYDDMMIMKKMMTAIVSIYELDKDTVSNYGEVVELVNSASYDGKYLYLKFAKISNVKMMRLEQGKSQKQVAEKMGCSVSTIRNCEEFYCDFSRQPETLVYKLAKALSCEPEDIMN